MSQRLAIARVLPLALLLTAAIAFASSYSGTLSITCTGFGDSTPNAVTFDRDNTGSGAEAYEYVATDGAGTVLFTFSSQLPLGSYTLGSAVYTTAPAFNPITVTLTSLAGNGLPAQTIFSIKGICAGLPGQVTPIPTLSEWGLISLAGLLASVAVIALRRRFF